MKKLIYLVLLAVTFSCAEESPKLVPQKETALIKELEPYFTQNIKGNNLAEDKLAKDASKVYLDFLKKENSIADYPVFFESGLDAGGGKSWVKFRTGFGSSEISTFPSYKFYDRVSFQIMAKVDNEVAETLQIEKPYYLEGKLIEKGWRASGGYYEFNPSYFDYDLNFDNVTYKINAIK